MSRKIERRYSSVARTIWGHPKFLALEPAPKPNPRYLLFRLLIAPESNSIPGLFQAWPGGLANNLGWSERSLLTQFGKLTREGWAKADWKVGLVWIPGAIDQDGNQPVNPNVVRGWRGPIAELPDCELKAIALRNLHEWATEKGEKWAEALDEALGRRRRMASPNPSGKSQPKPLVQPSPIQEQEQEQEQEASKLAKAGGRARFIELPRAPGDPPRPRKDPLNERLTFAKWFPTQQWLDWAKEAGISDELFNKTLVEARDKLTGAHDIEWWDMKILRFFANALRFKQSSDTQTSVVSA